MNILPVNNSTISRNYNSSKLLPAQIPSFRGKTVPLDFDFSKIGNLGEKIQEQLSNEKTREIFMGILIAGASVLTDIIVNGKESSSVKDLYDKIKESFNVEKGQEEVKQEVSENSLQQEEVKQEVSESPLPDEAGKSIDDILNKNILKYPAIAKIYDDLKSEGKEHIKNTLDNILDKLENECDEDFSKKVLTVINDSYQKEDVKNLALVYEQIAKQDEEPTGILREVATKVINPKNLKNWLEFPLFNTYEFLQVNNLPEKSIKQIYLLKKKNLFKTFMLKKVTSENYEDDNKYIFSLDFYPNTNLKDKLKIITKFHEAIYGNITGTTYKFQSFRNFSPSTLKYDLVKTIASDEDLEPTYNFVKYLDPKSLGKYNKLSSDDVMILPLKSNQHAMLKEHLIAVVDNLNIDTDKFKSLVTLLNNHDIFDEYLGSRHAILRFVGRYVLRDNANTDNLEADCRKCMNFLVKELEYKLNTGYTVSKYKRINGHNPNVYLSKKSSLGNNVKMALMKDGKVHTIYSQLFANNMKVNPIFDELMNEENYDIEESKNITESPLKESETIQEIIPEESSKNVINEANSQKTNEENLNNENNVNEIDSIAETSINSDKSDSKKTIKQEYTQIINDLPNYTPEEKEKIIKGLKNYKTSYKKSDIADVMIKIGEKTGKPISADEFYYILKNSSGKKQEEQLNILLLISAIKAFNSNINIQEFLDKDFITNNASKCKKPTSYSRIILTFGTEKIKNYPPQLLSDLYSISSGNIDFMSDMIDTFNSYELKQIYNYLTVRYYNLGILDYTNISAISDDIKEKIKSDPNVIQDLRKYKKTYTSDNIKNQKYNILKRLGLENFVSISKN